MTTDNHYEDIPEGEYDGSEDDLREYAATINEVFGYDLDKRIADLEAALRQAQDERERLRAAHQELFRLARNVADQVRETSWSIGALNKLTQHIDKFNGVARLPPVVHGGRGHSPTDSIQITPTTGEEEE